MKMNSKTSGKIAFVIVTWNNQEIIKECLDSVAGQTYKDTQVHLVDNGSKDKTVAEVKKHHPDTTIIANKANYGFAKGNNIGVEAALKDKKVSHVVLLNSDAVLAPDWLKNILGYVAGKPRTAMAQGLTLDYFNHSIIDSTNIYVNLSGQASQAGYSESLRVSELRSKKVFGVNAAACLITRDFIEANPERHLFDESLFMYLEDVDLALRINLLGWNNYFCADAVAYHMGSFSSKRLASSYSLYMTYRNNTPVLFKNVPLRDFFGILLKAFVADRVTRKHMVRGGNKKLTKVLRRGRWAGVLRLPLYLGKRIRLQFKRRVSREYLRYLMTNPE